MENKDFKNRVSEIAKENDEVMKKIGENARKVLKIILDGKER